MVARSILRIKGPNTHDNSTKTKNMFGNGIQQRKTNNRKHPQTGSKSRKDKENNDLKSTRKVDRGLELGSAMEGAAGRRAHEDPGID